VALAKQKPLIKKIYKHLYIKRLLSNSLFDIDLHRIFASKSEDDHPH